ncbi:MAG: DMT family transporter [Actinomycetota bacterium]|nr:DMT family transporter [Actinomycetota bacterium]
MAILLGLAAAVTYGAADFLGGLATKKTKVFTVVLVSQLIGSLLLLAAIPFFLRTEPTGSALMWGALSGIAGAAGVALFYQGLSLGRMGAIAPITAVEAASVPVLFGLVTGERPSALALAGVVLALVAVGLVSSSPEAASATTAAPIKRGWRDTGLAHAVGAGLAFGAFFILLDAAGDDTGLWPLAGARVSSIVFTAAALVATRGWDRPDRTSLPAIAGAGALDVAANLFYLLGSRVGLLSIVAVLTSMYPATTVLLARVTLNERLERVQAAGLAVAAAGVVAISLG